jgi:hypothetical protein
VKANVTPFLPFIYSIYYWLRSLPHIKVYPSRHRQSNISRCYLILGTMHETWHTLLTRACTFKSRKQCTVCHNSSYNAMVHAWIRCVSVSGGEHLGFMQIFVQTIGPTKFHFLSFMLAEDGRDHCPAASVFTDVPSIAYFPCFYGNLKGLQWYNNIEKVEVKLQVFNTWRNFLQGLNWSQLNLPLRVESISFKLLNWWNIRFTCSKWMLGNSKGNVVSL